MPKIVFFNHYHRGDLHTHKEFIRQLQQELPDFDFEYLHNNPAKLIEDLGIPTTGTPENLNNKEPYYYDGNELYINTWVGCDWDIFCKHGGINMHTLYEQWENIFNTINSVFDKNIQLKTSKEEYLPRIDYTTLNTSSIDTYVNSNKQKKVLICNNVPHSNQSFVSDMKDIINDLAFKNIGIDFICTNKFASEEENVIFTTDIIDTDDGIDLREISYLSTKCDIIVGKNSGPYVFCETYDNFMDKNKTFISFNIKNPAFDDIKETMSNGLDIECNYTAIPIENVNLTDADTFSIIAALNGALNEET
jgi:hypothetical protein